MQHLPTNTLLQGGKYKIERVLGQGGFGVTYLATQVMLERKVCIKEFFFKDYCNRTAAGEVTAGTTGSKEIVERFLNKFLKEARTISRLDHPNIIRILDIFEENGTAYYVMEYIDGYSLEDNVNRQGALSENEAIGYIKQVGNALEYIHQNRINHLDVKPANVMIRRNDNKAILIDFGVSKQYDEQGGQTSTTPVGISYGYAPMEQYNPSGVSTFSSQTDIYSLGATLYKLVTGNTPPHAMEIFNMGLSSLPRSLSSNLSSAIQKAMQPRRNDRPQSIKDFLNMLSVANVHQKKSSYSSSKPSVLANEITKIIEPLRSKNEINGHEYVDLGLPSGLKWATYNIGANNPEEAGNYFAWGETKTKSEYYKDNSLTINLYTGLLLSRGIISSNGNLTASYDAATANWGIPWRMPTLDEIKELIDECTWSWTTLNNVTGYMVTGPNGNSIFLPTAGWCHNSSTMMMLGYRGFYRTATIGPGHGDSAFELFFDSGNRKWNSGNRAHGCSVRPVTI